MDNTAKATDNSDVIPSGIIIGAIIDAEVIIATVDEPWAVFKAAAIRNGNHSPKEFVPRIFPISTDKGEF